MNVGDFPKMLEAVALENPPSRESLRRAVNVLIGKCPSCVAGKVCAIRSCLKARHMGGQYLFSGPAAVLTIESAGVCPAYQDVKEID